MKCEIELRRNQNRVFAAGEAFTGSVVLKFSDPSLINGLFDVREFVDFLSNLYVG